MISIAASPASANVHVQALRRPSHARARVRGIDNKGFSNKPPSCFLFSFLSFFCFFSFFPSFSLLLIFVSFLLPVHNSPVTLAADEIWVQKRRAVSDAPKAWFWGVVSWISPCFVYFKALSKIHRKGV
jgi:hypothetical protein